MKRPRSLFLGHGVPTLALSTHPATTFLRELGESLAPPLAVVVVSPHRLGASFAPGNALQFHAWHDFGGFAPELYDLRYDPPGDPALATHIEGLLRGQGLPARLSGDARIDHGIWVPLRRLWPEAQIPIVPVSQLRSGPTEHFELGEALRPLYDEGVLVIGSGSITHNLGDLDLADEMAPVQTWAKAFDAWIAEALAEGDIARLLRYRELAPHAVHAHPTEDHLLPLFVALGAGGAGTSLYRGFSHGSISLSAYAFA